MKIRDRYTGGGVGGPGQIRERGKTAAARETAGPASTSDRVQLSGRSVEIQRARAAALQAPEIRQEMVDEVLGQIEQGNYDVTGTDVAPRLIRDHLAGWRE